MIVAQQNETVIPAGDDVAELLESSELVKLSADEFGLAFDFPILTAMIVVPLITAIAILFIPKGRQDILKLTALAGSVLTGLLSFYMLWHFQSDVGQVASESDAAKFQFVEWREWSERLGIGWLLAVDGISLFLVVLTGLLFPVAIVTTKPQHDPKPYYFWLLVLMSGSMGAFTALDLLLFFSFFEVVLVPMYFLIGGWGHSDRLYSAMKFFVYTMAASALMLVGILSLVFLDARANDRAPSFSVVELANHDLYANIGGTASLLIFLSFALAFAVKVPLFPLHTWLPDAHTEAPTAGSVILAGVMLKLGTYGFLRFGLYLFPNVVSDLAPVFLTLGVIGIVYGAAVATMQKDLKRLVAYSSVAHMGFIVVGIFALNSQGVQGSVLQMISHGVSTGALFILVGWVYDRRHTRQISELGGLQKSAPIMAGVFTLVMLSSVGLPGLNGFVGEFLILLGAFETARWWAVVAVTGVILAALYLLWAYQRSFHGPAKNENSEMPDLSIAEILGIAPLLFLIVAMGIYPKPVLERIEPSVDKLLAHVAAEVDDLEIEVDQEPVAAVEAVSEHEGSADSEHSSKEDGHEESEESHSDEGEGSDQ